MSRKRVLWYWQSMGPYHYARMSALAARPDIDLVVVEGSSLDDHKWERSNSASFPMITLTHEELSSDALRRAQTRLVQTLVQHKPDMVVAPGYAQPLCLRPILTFKNSVPRTLIILWTESTIMDLARSRPREMFKTLVLPIFDGALVAGKPHADYLKRLRMPPEDIQVVGNCVDNDYFFSSTRKLHAQPVLSSGPPIPASKYFLYVGRMIPVKNLTMLLRAYSVYRQKMTGSAWDLVLVGGGPDESQLRDLVRAEKIGGVHFAGIRQLEELPFYYAHAGCFILPSSSEPWGLVVNEAMASGLPVLASDRCGCAVDLIREGVNGFVFDPFDQDALTHLLLKMSDGTVPLGEFGSNSQEIISDYSPMLFAERASSHLSSLYSRKGEASGHNGDRRSIRRVIAENAYALFGASLELSRTSSLRSRARAS